MNTDLQNVTDWKCLCNLIYLMCNKLWRQISQILMMVACHKKCVTKTAGCCAENYSHVYCDTKCFAALRKHITKWEPCIRFSSFDVFFRQICQTYDGHVSRSVECKCCEIKCDTNKFLLLCWCCWRCICVFEYKWRCLCMKCNHVLMLFCTNVIVYRCRDNCDVTADMCI